MRVRQSVIIAATGFWLVSLSLPAQAPAESPTPSAQGRAAIAKEEAALAHEAAVVAARRAALEEKKAMLARDDTARPSSSATHATGVEQELADLKAQETERGLVLTLGDVLFAPEEAKLTPDALHKLDPLVALLKAQPKRHIRIAGYADSTGREASNLDLSQRRADAVRDFLVDNGIHPDRITARGYGEAAPVASNATAAGRKENRRVEVLVLRAKK